jgi:hypothetical protein
MKLTNKQKKSPPDLFLLKPDLVESLPAALLNGGNVIFN